MDEYVLAAVIRLDESIAFLVIVELHGTDLHRDNLHRCSDSNPRAMAQVEVVGRFQEKSGARARVTGQTAEASSQKRLRYIAAHCSKRKELTPITCRRREHFL